MKLIIAGSRAHVPRQRDTEIITRVVEELGVTEIVHGAQTGADTMGENYARAMGIRYSGFPGNWKKYGHKVCYLMRNSAMAAYCEPSDACLLFPGGDGTADMRRKAKARGMTVIEAYEK